MRPHSGTTAKWSYATGRQCIRAAAPEEDENLIRFYRSLAAESRRLRFFSSATDIDAEARREVVNDATHVALVAIHGPGDRIVGHAMFAQTAQDCAEVALAVADDWQGRGLGPCFLGSSPAWPRRRTSTASRRSCFQRITACWRRFGNPAFGRRRASGEGDVLVTISTALSPTVQFEFDRPIRLPRRMPLLTY